MTIIKAKIKKEKEREIKVVKKKERSIICIHKIQILC